MKRTTARALTVTTSLALAGVVAASGNLGTLASASAAAPAVRPVAFTAVAATYHSGATFGAPGAVHLVSASSDAADGARVRAARAHARAAAARRAAHAKQVRAAAARRAHRLAANTSLGGTPRAIGRQLAAARGWTGAQWAALDQLWTAESGWAITASNPYGAYGIPQALPGSKMAAAGAGWRSDARTQIAWGLDYIAGRWGSPEGAWAHFQDVHWY